MLGNIWLTSALIVTAIFSASAVYKSYSDIQEAKQIQEHYQIVSDIKALLAKQYNKNPQDITRDEIIANLPTGGNWEKILLLDRNDSSTINTKELINSKGQIEISKDERLKLLALKAKLKDTLNTSSATLTGDKYTFEVGFNKNLKQKDEEVDRSVSLAINYLANEILYQGKAVDTTFVDTILKFTPYNNIYQDFGTTIETELKLAKENYFKEKIKEKLILNNDAMEAKLYYKIKDEF